MAVAESGHGLCRGMVRTRRWTWGRGVVASLFLGRPWVTSRRCGGTCGHGGSAVGGARLAIWADGRIVQAHVEDAAKVGGENALRHVIRGSGATIVGLRGTRRNGHPEGLARSQGGADQGKEGWICRAGAKRARYVDALGQELSGTRNRLKRLDPAGLPV